MRRVHKTTNRFNIEDFGAAIDGVTDDSVAWQGAIDAATKFDGTVVHPGGGESLIDATVNNREVVDMIGEGDAWVKPGPNVFEVFQIGESNAWSGPFALTADSLSGSWNIDAATPSLPGQIIWITSPVLLPNDASGYVQGQTAVVAENSGTQITIDMPVYDNYLVSDAAEVWVFDSRDTFRAENIHFSATDDPSNVGRAWNLDGIRHVHMHNMEFLPASFSSIRLTQCADVHVSDITTTHKEVSEAGQYGYGVVLIGGARQHLHNIIGKQDRHTITTLPDNGPTGTPAGGPIDSLISNSQSTASYHSGMDEHAGAMTTNWKNCVVTGCNTHGFQVRGRGSVVEGCSSSFNGFSGLVVQDDAEDTLVQSSRFWGNGRRTASGGIVMVDGSRNTTVQSNYLQENNGAGVRARGSNVTISQNIVHRNSDSAVEDLGVSGVSHVTLNDLSGDGPQAISLENGGASVRFANNVCLGYGAGSDGATGAATSTDNSTD